MSENAGTAFDKGIAPLERGLRDGVFHLLCVKRGKRRDGFSRGGTGRRAVDFDFERYVFGRAALAEPNGNTLRFAKSLIRGLFYGKIATRKENVEKFAHVFQKGKTGKNCLIIQ